MNTVQLECFTAVAEHLNFSKASKALKLTQPAVSPFSLSAQPGGKRTTPRSIRHRG